MPFYPGTRKPSKKELAAQAAAEAAAKSTADAAAEAVEGPTPAASRISPLSALGLIGLSSIEAPVLAALATEAPLLLIGPHGTAKSLLLTRIAQALGLPWRHYNASLLNFDDLVGFPVPGPGGTLSYAQTPASVWGAGAVFLDEISRCRPDIQNKLFPIIHERKVQGLPLPDLRFRWAAMNPPARDGEDGTGPAEDYAGSEPLDAALADRFPFIVTMPGWAEMNEADQLAIIRASDQPVSSAAAQSLRSAIERTQQGLAALQTELEGPVAQYVRTLVQLLLQAGVSLSPRRASMLLRAVLAVHAANRVLDAAAAPSNSALMAVRNALPQRAQGLAVPDLKLLAVHKEAWRLAQVPEADPLRVLLATRDPVDRLRLALATSGLTKTQFSQVVGDSVAQLPLGGREAAAVHLFDTGAVGRLNAAVAAELGAMYQGSAQPQTFSETLHGGHERFRCWRRIKDLMSKLDPACARDHLAANTMAALFARQAITTEEEAERAFAAFREVDQRLAA